MGKLGLHRRNKTLWPLVGLVGCCWVKVFWPIWIFNAQVQGWMVCGSSFYCSASDSPSFTCGFDGVVAAAAVAAAEGMRGVDLTLLLLLLPGQLV